MMHRIFVPVGQGAFYLEKFEIGEEKFNIVYDCGTSTETVKYVVTLKRMKRLIMSLFLIYIRIILVV